MRHRMGGKKLGRKTAHRMSMLRNLVTSLLSHEHIRTTLPRAKAVRPVAERMITLGKRESLHARRQALGFIKDPAIVSKLFSDLAPRYADRKGGYTRIIKLGFRDGDGAQTALVELLGSEYKPDKGQDKTTKKGRREKAARPRKESGEKAAAKTAKSARKSQDKTGDQKKEPRRRRATPKPEE